MKITTKFIQPRLCSAVLFLLLIACQPSSKEVPEKEIQAKIESEVQAFARKAGMQFLDIKFGTTLDSRDSALPDEVKARASAGTKVYPVRWHGHGWCRFLTGTWAGDVNVLTFVQDIYYFTDNFGELDSIGTTTKVTDNKAGGGLFDGLPVAVGVN